MWFQYHQLHLQYQRLATGTTATALRPPHATRTTALATSTLAAAQPTNAAHATADLATPFATPFATAPTPALAAAALAAALATSLAAALAATAFSAERPVT